MMVVEREQQRRAASGGGAAAAPAPARRTHQQSHYATAPAAPARPSSASVARERLGLAPLPPAVPAPSPARAPMAHRGPRVVRRAKALGWWNPMTLAVLGASFAASLSCLYLTAYVHVFQQGNDLAKMRRELKAERDRTADLEARIDAMRHDRTIAVRAKRLGLVPAPSAALNILDAPPSPAGRP